MQQIINKRSPCCRHEFDSRSVFTNTVTVTCDQPVAKDAHRFRCRERDRHENLGRHRPGSAGETHRGDTPGRHTGPAQLGRTTPTTTTTTTTSLSSDRLECTDRLEYRTPVAKTPPPSSADLRDWPPHCLHRRDVTPLTAGVLSPSSTSSGLPRRRALSRRRSSRHQVVTARRPSFTR